MALAVKDVYKSFGAVKAVQGVSFEVHPGRVCGLLGSNGAGKTTTMRMIMRILLPDQGAVTWNGQTISNDTRRGFGYLPEERGLYPKMQARDQLIYLTELKGLSRADAAVRVDRWIDRLNLGEFALRRAEQLSKGNQQKVQFAAAAASGPDLCILDEPFSGLDPVNTIVMEEAFRTLAAEGCTILFSSHNMDQVESLCQDVVLIHRSKSVLAGSLREIKRSVKRSTVQLNMDVDSYGFLADLAGTSYRTSGSGVEISLSGGVDAQQVLAFAMEKGPILSYSVGAPSLKEIYLEKVGGHSA